jgi:hypothetical protein
MVPVLDRAGWTRVHEKRQGLFLMIITFEPLRDKIPHERNAVSEAAKCGRNRFFAVVDPNPAAAQRIGHSESGARS